MNQLFNFPGNETFSTILACVVTVFCEMALFYLVLLFLKYYVPGKKYPYLVFGRFAGVLLSIVLAAPLFTYTFTRYFPLSPDATTIVLIVFIILSIVLAFTLYKQPEGGTHETGSQNSQGT